MTLFLDHIGIAVRSIEERSSLWVDILGLAVHAEERVEEMGVKLRMLDLNGTRLELLEPLSEESPVGKFIAKKGEGIHHLSFAVPDIRASMRRLADQGIKLIDQEPRIGHGGCRVAFIHPGSAGGVLLELKEVKRQNLLDILSEDRIRKGSIVILSLTEPREKFWGLLKSMDPIGVQLLGIELDAVGDLFREIMKGEAGAMGLTSIFFPMGRVEKIFLDESVGGVRSLHEHFASLAGTTFDELLNRIVGRL